MVMPAPKTLDDVSSLLNECTASGYTLGDMERYHIVKRLEEMRHIKPIQVFVCFGVLANIDHDEIGVRKNFERALSYNKDSAYVNFNYGIALMMLGYTGEAVNAFMTCLKNGIDAAQYLDKMAIAAIEIGNIELSEKILYLADKLEIQTEHIRLLAMDTLLSMTSSPDEEAEILNAVFSDEKLKEESLPYTEEEWNEMRDFANKLKEYI